MNMNDYSILSVPELNDRIAILRDNIRQLMEQATGSSGSGNEERTADRIAQQQEELDALIRERESRTKK
jgi:DNA integrity scanning protein DisA with diadenylate cyclase activity